MKKFKVSLLLILSLTALQGQPSKTSQELSRDSLNLALAYGAEAVDRLDIAYRIIYNQKAEIEQLYGLVYNIELQTEVLTKVITKIQRKTFWQKLWAWMRGALAGGAAMVIIQELTK